jgi:hypothetical protein
MRSCIGLPCRDKDNVVHQALVLLREIRLSEFRPNDPSPQRLQFEWPRISGTH